MKNSNIMHACSSWHEVRMFSPQRYIIRAPISPCDILIQFLTDPEVRFIYKLLISINALRCKP